MDPTKVLGRAVLPEDTLRAGPRSSTGRRVRANWLGRRRRMNRLDAVVAMAMAVAMALVGTSAAGAADPAYVNTGGGADGGPVVRTAAQQKLYDRKVKLANEYAAVSAGSLDYATFRADFDAFLPKAGVASPLSKAAATATATASTASTLTLALSQKAQKKTYYCGPAVVAEMLDFMNIATGPNGESMTQANLAGSCKAGYLCTDHLGETPWYYASSYPHPMRTTLNTWKGVSWYEVENDMSHWVDDLRADIGWGWPIASNVNEWNGSGYHLVGHPTNATIGHWVAVHGYKDSGDTTYYADSVHGTTFWSWSDDVPAHSYISSARFEWLMSNNSKGFVW
jgi:Peptidase_C39 like family